MAPGLMVVGLSNTALANEYIGLYREAQQDDLYRTAPVIVLQLPVGRGHALSELPLHAHPHLPPPCLRVCTPAHEVGLAHTVAAAAAGIMPEVDDASKELGSSDSHCTGRTGLIPPAGQ